MSRGWLLPTRGFRRARQSISFMLVTAVAATLVSAPITEAPAEAACANDATTEAAAATMAARCGVDVEVADARTELTQTFVEPSGTRRLEAAVSTQRVRRDDGSWDPVSTRLAVHGDGRIAAAA